MVPRAGIEPARESLPRDFKSLASTCSATAAMLDTILSLWRRGRNRTGVHGFAGRCITTLPPRRTCCALVHSGAGDETRTRDPNLGKVVLYQLSYSRKLSQACQQNQLERETDSNSRPQPWQGCALPTELLPQLTYARRLFLLRCLLCHKALTNVKIFLNYLA